LDPSKVEVTLPEVRSAAVQSQIDDGLNCRSHNLISVLYTCRWIFTGTRCHFSTLS